MPDEQLNDKKHRQLGGRPLRFRLRHILYLFTVICLLLGIPGWRFIAGWVIGPWLMFAVIIGPLICMQFLFILLIPSLRHKLLGRETTMAGREPQDPNVIKPATSA